MGEFYFKKRKVGFQGLRLGVFTARSGGSIPGQETKLPTGSAVGPTTTKSY